MPRTARVAPGGMVFHVLNRGVARMQLFEKAADYQAFEQVLRDTLDRSPMRICAYAVMPNHWHLLLWPECDGELAAFMQRLTITHARRWQEHRGYAGLGHVYQGRYKSFPVESDEHFWVVARYVERNALRANLVLRAEEWRWSSLWQRCHPTGEERSLLAAWPIDMPANWPERVNQTDNAQDLEALRRRDGNRDAISIGSNPLLRIPSKLIASRFPTPSRLFHCFILSCSEKTAPEEQAGAARSTDRRETRGMSLICQCMIRSGVLNRECPWMRPVLQSGHGVAAARQGIGRATRIGPSDGSQVVAGWKRGRSEFLILAMSPFLLPDQ